MVAKKTLQKKIPLHQAVKKNKVENSKIQRIVNRLKMKFQQSMPMD